MAGKGIGQAQIGRQLRAIKARAQDPDRHLGALPRHGADAGVGVDRAKVVDQLHHVFGELVRGFHVAAQRPRRAMIGARRAAKAKVDAVRIKAGQRAELLGNHQGRVVGQHDAARADPNGLGAARDMADHDRGRSRGDAGHVVMLGQPKAVIALCLGMAGKVQRIGQRLGGGLAFGNRGKIEERILHGSPAISGSPAAFGKALALEKPRAVR